MTEALCKPDSTGACLLADVGGTNARFAWVAAPGEPIAHVQVLPCAAHATLQAAMRHYIDALGQGEPTHAAIAIATAVTGDAVRMTNHHWAFSQAELKAAFGLQRLAVLNDFTALALALPVLPAANLRQVGDGTGRPGEAVALLGAGTGLGVSGLLPDGQGGWLPIRGEGGHVTLPAQTARERLVADGLARLHGHASAERMLCGPGLLDTYRLLCEADGALAACADPAAVTTSALEGTDAQAVEALHMFCALLGSVAGNLALTLGALGGIYIGGGIVPRLGTWLETTPFLERLRAKGRFAPYLSGIPVWVITAQQSPALLGAARALG
jgi:glucokinase